MIQRCILAGVLAACLFAIVPTRAADAPKTKFTVYVGTYSRGTKSEGIYRATFDSTTGKLSEPVVAAKTANPTFLAIHPNGKFLYAVGEIGDFGKKKNAGSIDAFAIEASGDLKFLNAESSGGGGPCHLVVDKAGKFVMGANYGGGSVCVLPIDKSGKVGPATAFIQHPTDTSNPKRAKKPHGHSINLDTANNYAIVADLGLDKLFVYKFDKEAGKITPNDPPATLMKPGAGPRHFAFHPSGKFAYVCNELDSTVSTMQYDASTGKLTVIDTFSTLPKEHKGNSTAEIVVHPNGQFLYVSNRGHNSIAQFLIDEKTGKPIANGHQGTGIKIPRNFVLDPTGKWCLVANQDGNSVIVFKVNPRTGKLETTDEKIEVARPVCLRFLTK